MSFESRYIKRSNIINDPDYITGVQSKIKAFINVDSGKIEVSLKKVPKYGLHISLIEDHPIMGTEIFFEGKLFYPVLLAHKSEVGWNVTKPDFLIKEEMFFFNPSLGKEETELDLQLFFKTVDPQNWKHYIEELNNQGFEALKIALQTYIKENKK